MKVDNEQSSASKSKSSSTIVQKRERERGRENSFLCKYIGYDDGNGCVILFHRKSCVSQVTFFSLLLACAHTNTE